MQSVTNEFLPNTKMDNNEENNLDEVIDDKDIVLQAYRVTMKLSENKMISYQYLQNVWKIRDRLLDNHSITKRDLLYLKECSLLSNENNLFFGKTYKALQE